MVRRGDLVVTGSVAVVHPVHVGGVLDPAAAWRVDEPEEVRSDRVPAQMAGLVPAAIDHVVGADDHLIHRGDLPRGVVDARPVSPVAKQQRVVVGIAGGAHEHADLGDPVGRDEAEPAGVEGDGLFLAGLDDVERHVAQPQRADPPGVAQRLVPALFLAGTVPRRILAAGPGFLLADGEADTETGLVDRVRLVMFATDLPVGGQPVREFLQ